MSVSMCQPYVKLICGYINVMTLDIIYDIDADKSWARLHRNAECFT